VLASGALDAASERRLRAVYRVLDPVRLLKQLESLQEALWRHAMFRTRGHSAISDLVARFDLGACGGPGEEATAEALVRLRPDGTPKRKYRRTEKSKGPRLYRSRKDPFETVWDEVCQWLTGSRPRTAGKAGRSSCGGGQFRRSSSTRQPAVGVPSSSALPDGTPGR
jgi:hypothetical protein